MMRSALIVAHGQPSEPGPPEAEMAALAARVAGLLPGWQVGAATLAGRRTLEAEVRRLGAPTVFPFFMADGWFIRTMLPKRLAEAGAEGMRILTPFGLLAEVEALAIRLAREGAAERGWAERETVLILAAHGSGASRKPAEAAGAIRDAIVAAVSFREVRLGFIEEAPFLSEVLRDAGERAVLLPLFVARWGHVEGDIPEAVAEAGFRGVVLDPIGTDAAVPAIIAGAIRASH